MRRRPLIFAAVVLLGIAVYAASAVRMFPPDTTPEGAYMRIAKSIGEGRVRDIFAYLETDAQWAAYTIRDMRAKAYARVGDSYPEPERTKLRDAYRDAAEAPDGADVFAMEAARKNWLARLRKDLSGIARVEVNGERATVVTARGTRYPFRRRENGIWGLTIFTADLIAESERASRDLQVVNEAADDYERVRNVKPSP